MTDMMMALNRTDNSTYPHSSESQSGGLAVGLPLLFVALAALIGIVAYFYFQRRKSEHEIHRNKFQIAENQPTKAAESKFKDSDKNSHGNVESAVYENFRDISASRHYSNINFDSPGDPANLYLQCDSEHDAIYSNDPTFSYRNQPDHCEEDVYIMPDA